MILATQIRPPHATRDAVQPRWGGGIELMFARLAHGGGSCLANPCRQQVGAWPYFVGVGICASQTLVVNRLGHGPFSLSFPGLAHEGIMPHKPLSSIDWGMASFLSFLFSLFSHAIHLVPLPCFRPMAIFLFVPRRAIPECGYPILLAVSATYCCPYCAHQILGTLFLHVVVVPESQ